MSNAGRFVHLHCHSHYSLLDGASPIEGLIAKAKCQGMNALALTDHGNLYGALEFYEAAKAAEINPIIGYEAYIAPGSRFQKEADANQEASYHLTLLAQNRTGFQNLVKLASSAFLEGFYRKPRIDKELLAAHSEGLICLSGCVSGELSRSHCAGNAPNRIGTKSKKSSPGFSKHSATRTSSKSRIMAWKSSGWRSRGRCASRSGWDCRWWPRAMPIT